MINLFLATIILFSGNDINNLNIGSMDVLHPESATWNSVEPIQYHQLGIRRNVIGNLWSESISENYAIEAQTDTLWSLNSLHPILIGNLQYQWTQTEWKPLDVSRVNGFSVIENVGWLTTNDGEDGFGSRLFRINLLDAKSQYIGIVGNIEDHILINGMEPIPEPSLVAFVIMGMLVYFIVDFLLSYLDNK